MMFNGHAINVAFVILLNVLVEYMVLVLGDTRMY